LARTVKSRKKGCDGHVGRVTMKVCRKLGEYAMLVGHLEMEKEMGITIIRTVGR
jgi:hypothetical protein